MKLHPPQLLPGMTESGAQWAYRLMEREARGEQLQDVSKSSWREVLGYAKDVDAKAALVAYNNERKAA